MLAERYLKKRYQIGRDEGIEVGREEGREEGIEMGRVEGREEGIEMGRVEGIEEGVTRERAETRRRQKRHNARLKAWDARRLKSIAEGEPFDEPMPEFDDDDESEEGDD